MIGRETRIEPAQAPRGYQHERLLVVDPLTWRIGDYRISELPQLFHREDTLVVNDAATLPASLRVDDELELRLVSAHADGTFDAITFGSGDFRQATEARGTPRALSRGQRLLFAPELAARIVSVDAEQPRLVRLRFETAGADFLAALYGNARPIQYSYAPEPLALWDLQNRYASRPWAFELPSAGRPLTFATLFDLERRGARLAYVTSAAGISSTGNPALDARLPLAERYEIPASTAAALARCRRVGARIVATGTSVVRALESHVSQSGDLEAGSGETTLRLSETYQPRVVDGLLTGLHEPGTSHFELLEAFAPRALLLRAMEHAAKTAYLQHEFGDSCLILAGALLDPSSAA